MEIIRMLKFKRIIYIFLVCILCNCKEQKDKSITTDNSINTVKLETSCFVKQKIINESKDFVYKYEDFEYKINQNNESANNLIINNKEYATNLILESADIHFHYYKCNDKKIFFIEGDDYYSSTFFVYYYENENLFYSGTFSIDQPNVENDGVLSKRFELFANNNQIEIQSFIDNKEHKKFIFKERTKILLSEIKSIANVENEIKGLWSVTCENELTLLDISNNIGYLSLNSDNAIYINVNVIKVKQNEYNLTFKNTESQKNYYQDKPKVNDEEISKTEIIGKITLKENKKMELNWFGLLNLTTNRRDFVKEFLLVRENGGVNPVILSKCN